MPPGEPHHAAVPPGSISHDAMSSDKVPHAAVTSNEVSSVVSAEPGRQRKHPQAPTCPAILECLFKVTAKLNLAGYWSITSFTPHTYKTSAKKVLLFSFHFTCILSHIFALILVWWIRGRSRIFFQTLLSHRSVVVPLVIFFPRLEYRFLHGPVPACAVM
jgi:hypothetical protein